ncbi:hypothetical protein T06_2480 [Trichinella sp. T6]|nr:hypothetical protein T06_2480 [Trichinella sp. T6]
MNLCKNPTCSITDSYQRMQQFHSSISKRNLILEIFAVQAKTNNSASLFLNY